MTKPIQMGVRGRSPRTIAIPALALRVIGVWLLLGALLLPWAATWRRARRSSPPPGRTLQLRPELVVLPASHDNKLRPFAISSTRITVEHLSAVLDGKPAPGADRDQPAVVLFRPYCNRLSELEGWPPCYQGDLVAAAAGCTGYRLPTKAELEYAARADQPEASVESPNRWGLSDLDHPDKLLRDESQPLTSTGFVVVRTCPDPPQSCGRPQHP